jgi:predicted nucleic acid-binding protein
MILLDSNTIIYLSKGLLRIDDVLPDGQVYAVSIITYMEVMGYPFESKEEEQIISDLLGHFKIIMIDQRIADRVITLRKTYKIKLPDAIICATAIINHATLFSNDERLKQINELKLVVVRPTN